jgi:hypothetical protein
VEPGAIYWLTERHTMVVVDPENGLELTRFTLDRPGQPTAWTAGRVYARDRFIAVERLAPGMLHPVLVAGT